MKAAQPQQLRHPAHRLYLLTLLLLGLTVLFGFIAVFVPWVMKDIAIGTRAWAYPFKTCLEDTFSKINQETCQDNDFIVGDIGTPLTGGNSTCKAFVLATIAFVFINVIGGVLVLLALAYILDQMWNRPVCLGVAAQILLVVVCIASFLAWIMFICYAEKTCAPNSIFPAKGYSYGFILYIFASAFNTGAVVTGFMGLSRLRAFRPEEADAAGMQPLAPGSPESPRSLASPYPQYPEYPEHHPMAAPTPLRAV